MINGNRMLLAMVLMLVCLMTTGCADHVTFSAASSHEPVGFWFGLWHGMILPIAWLMSIFDNDVAIYAIYNNGGWYDFGFILGASVLFTGGSNT